MSSQDQQQQQQQQQPAQAQAQTPTASSSSTAENTTTTTTSIQQQNVIADDSLLCQWEKCSERCQTPESLFEHICEKHVGRKSTNNLNLTCGWNSCRTTTVKRDHITSHIRVHVPLKPHKCEFCGKAFKRPQDLKKHVKTHADDSVLLRSPEQPGGPNGGYRQGGGKVIANLQNLAANPIGYYDHNASMHPGSAAVYGNSHHGAHPGYYAPPAQQSSYGGAPGYYQMSHNPDLGQHAAWDEKRRNFDNLNDFFGAAKRRQIDAHSYHQVNQRLMQLQGIPIGTGGGISDYMHSAPQLIPLDGHGGHGGHGHGGPMPQHQYSLPLPNLRTKNDLNSMDQFLEQMQSTVYESSNAAAAAGIHQPGVHYTHQGINFRQSHSPSQSQIHNIGSMPSHVSTSYASAPMTATHSSHSSGTPALTPSSSVSYTSGNSPMSSSGLSPISRHSSTSTAAYPNLPAVSLGYSPHHSATAPTSTLGTNFDSDLRRRYSGGVLQRSAGGLNTSQYRESSEASTIGSPTPSPKETTPRPESIVKTDVTNNLDPALSGVSSPADRSIDSGESARDRAEEAWIENIRVIEALRRYVSERLQNGEYVKEEEDTSMTDTEMKDVPAKTEEKPTESLYPVLRTDDDE
ncbi:zinc finger protein Pac1 [Sclerotinia borealis F-4128]|uniref:Zinc finger protein Pac1 n=1 Tax=Sclerotinia borealis (strain F-4128) TaxID=1432307 RepID=W9CLM7_SCLBF|nr:zinc finger protein Pac1 [Sclerotinia borealis F-4128]